MSALDDAHDAIAQRMLELVAAGAPYSADELTSRGALAVDAAHGQSGAQSAIGAQFRMMAKRGWIEKTGEYRRSSSPRRKGGMILEWQPTERGIAGARAQLGQGRLDL